MEFDPKESLAISKAKFDAEIVTKTLDTLNSGQFYAGGAKKKTRYGAPEHMKESTEFQKNVLNAVYSGKGAIANSKS